MERGWKPYVDISPTCPRCGSSNTKFCYYNNYSLTQPRYFCKGCRRYWTKGGSLRNVPVGGGCRKTRRGKAVRITRHGLSSRDNSVYGNSQGAANGNSMAESSTNPASNIDLAVVYANFLNQQPRLDETKQLEMPSIILPDSNHVGFEFSNVGVDFGSRLLRENCGNECTTDLLDWSLDIHNSKDLLYICGMDDESIGDHDKQQNIMSGTNDMISNYDELPPLPGEEMVMWSNSQMNNIVNDIPNQTLHGTQVLLGMEPEFEADHGPSHELIGNRSMFDHLPNYGTTFTRP